MATATLSAAPVRNVNEFNGINGSISNVHRSVWIPLILQERF